MSYEDLSASRKQLPPLGESRLQATADRRRDSDGLVGAALGVAGGKFVGWVNIGYLKLE